MTLLNKLFLAIVIPTALYVIVLCFKAGAIVSDVEKGKIPKQLAEFPTHETSKDFYDRTKRKMENFVDSALEDRKAEIELNEAEINTLYTQGIFLDKYKRGTYLHYEIEEDKIVEKMIVYPFPSMTGYVYKEKWIYFFTDTQFQEKNLVFDGSWTEPHEIIILISHSPLISFILGGSRSSEYLRTHDRKTVEYQKVLKIIENLKKVEIQNGYLIIGT
ncbi:hypothetical protein [Lusitaniella coriacea]|uniref:hypothetical protein n=1 Tax=Lusitaniella coriacea TaxID=1983105 RepID=UPI003CED18C2